MYLDNSGESKMILQNLTSNCFKAIFAAIYLDQDLKTCRSIAERLFLVDLQKHISDPAIAHPVERLRTYLKRVKRIELEPIFEQISSNGL